MVLPALIAILAWFALVSEFMISLHHSLDRGQNLSTALYLYLRFFTILTNLFVAGLMSATVLRLVLGQTIPAASPFAAALVYVVVVGATYEALLRRLWSPQGLQFYTDMIMHDIVPVLVLCYWVFLAPKAPLRWIDPLRWLEFPAVYFAATLLAGLSGAGYPYGFLDADKLGYPGVAANALVFLAFFYLLGLAVTAAARASGRRADHRLKTAG